MIIEFIKLSSRARLPEFAHEGDAGADVFCLEDVVLEPGVPTKVPTGIASALSDGWVALIWDKSSVGVHKGVKVLGGVIDAGYRGEWLIGLINLTQEVVTFPAGAKVAQVLFQKVERPELTEVAVLDETTRGTGGFGSTGT